MPVSRNQHRTSHMMRTTFILSTLLLFGFSDVSVAQTGVQSDGTAYYTFARPGQNTIQVLLVGDVRRPGLYNVGEDIELVRLIGIAGGAGTEWEVPQRRRTVTVEVFRTGQGNRSKVYEASFDDVVSHQQPPPELAMGDVVQVKVIQRDRFNWRDGLNLAATVSGLAWAITRVVRGFR